FVATQPTRLLDTRAAGAPLGSESSVDLAVGGHEPPFFAGTITGVVMNVAAVSPTAAGYLTVWPGGARPLTSSVNFLPGELRSNVVTAAVDPETSVQLYNLAGSTHVVADLQGYFH